MAPMEFQHEGPMVQTIDYSDAGSVEQDGGDKSIAKGGVTTPFPWKLHDMLDGMARKGEHSVVTWQPHGRAFMVHKPKEFVVDIMPQFFNQTKYASFQRQLNLYGFSRLSHGQDKGAYYHMSFVRGERNLCRNMIRQKIKGTKVRRSLSPEEEPNFYLAHWSKTQIPTGEAVCTFPQANGPLHGPVPLSAQPMNVPSNPTRTAKPANRAYQESRPHSLVSMMRELPHPASSLVIPHPPVIKPLQLSGPTPALSNSAVVSPNGCVSAGDLLFFEGLPFRYLEHIEEIPPIAIQSAQVALPDQRNHPKAYKESLHNMISSVVSMESVWSGNKNHGTMCSV